MRVGVVGSDIAPCEFYRAGGPAQCLAEAGEIDYQRLTEQLTVRYANRRHGDPEPIAVVNPPDVDVVVFVRGVFPERMHEIMRLLQREGIAVVVDYDDAYRHLPPSLHARYKVNPNLNPHYNWKWAEEAADIADAVTVSTPALLTYHPGATVLRNRVPKRYLDQARKSDGKTVGWTGTVWGHPGDLPQCGAGVVEAMRQTDSRFYLVGDGYQVKEQLALDSQPAVSEIVPLDQYPREIAKLDVGIAPLHASVYTEAKSWLKPIEYLALGASYVASPTSEYTELQRQLEEWCSLNGCEPPGALAKSRTRDWRREVLRALRRPEDASQVARQFVRERMLLEDHAADWATVWEEAVKHRHN